MIYRVITLLSLAACVLADGQARSEQRVLQHFSPEHHGHHGELAHIGEKGPEHHGEYAWSFPSYEFSYKVEDPHTKDYKGQIEKRHGDEVVGEYWLLQPDGRKRIVKYRADKQKGFQAQIRYEPEHHGSPTPHHVEHVEERKPEKATLVGHKHHVHVEHKQVHKPEPHHEKPIHHVQVEHKFVYHKHKELEQEEPRPVERNLEERQPEEPNPVVPEPEEPRPEEPIPVEPEPEEPRPEEPSPEEPRREEPQPEEPQPEEPQPEEPQPEERQPEVHRPKHDERKKVHHYVHRPPLKHRHHEDRKAAPAHHHRHVHHEENHDRPFSAERVPLQELEHRSHPRVHQQGRSHHRVHHHDRPHHLDNWPRNVEHKAGRITELWTNEARRQEDMHHYIPNVPLYRPHEPYYGHLTRKYRHTEKSKKDL